MFFIFATTLNSVKREFETVSMSVQHRICLSNQTMTLLALNSRIFCLSITQVFGLGVERQRFPMFPALFVLPFACFKKSLELVKTRFDVNSFGLSLCARLRKLTWPGILYPVAMGKSVFSTLTLLAYISAFNGVGGPFPFYI